MSINIIDILEYSGVSFNMEYHYYIIYTNKFVGSEEIELKLILEDDSIFELTDNGFLMDNNEIDNDDFFNLAYNKNIDVNDSFECIINDYDSNLEDSIYTYLSFIDEYLNATEQQ